MLQQHQQQSRPWGHDASTPFAPLTTYRHAFLETSSMWGMGANARTVPPRRVNVPLVTWTEGAVRRVQEAWRSVQEAAPCHRAMYAYTSYWGITSQMRDYGDSALVSLAFRRPLHHIFHAMQPKWCSADAWLGCFFHGFEDWRLHRCYHDLSTRRNAATVTPLKPRFSTSRQRRETHARFEDSNPLVLEHLAELTIVLDHPMFFPTWLWDELIRDNLIRIVDASDRVVDPGWLKAHDRNLYHTLAVSALRTMLTPILFRPHAHLQQQVALKIHRIAMQDQGPSTRPCVALHLRWTDKASDGGVANVSRSSGRYNVDHVVPALDQLIRRRRGTAAYRRFCVLVLTDDDFNAMPLLAGALRHAKRSHDVELRVLSRVSTMFGPLDDYQLYVQLGHRYMSEVMSRRAPDTAFGYFAGLIVDILAASQMSDILIGAGSSGVSQLIAQYLGAGRMTDANALAIWQEDVICGVTMTK